MIKRLLLFSLLGIAVYFGMFRNKHFNVAKQKACTEKAEEEKYKQIKVKAFDAACDFVKKKLKAPSTAVFPNEYNIEADSTLGDYRFTVSSYVDAENSYGAHIRNKWKVELQYDDIVSKDWELISCEIE